MLSHKQEEWPRFDENGAIMSIAEACVALGLSMSTVRCLATRTKNPALQQAPKHRWRSLKAMELLVKSVEYYKHNRVRDARWNDDPKT